GRPGLTTAQKRQFVTGWSYWLSDAFGVLVAYLNLLWVPMILFVGVLIPTLPFTVPVLAAFGVNLIHCLMLYVARDVARVRLSPKRILGAALAAMSLQLTVARGVAEGLLGKAVPFVRTAKGGKAKKAGATPRAETITGLLLLMGGILLWVFNEPGEKERYVFAVTLLVQSTPFLAATLMAWIERKTASAGTAPS
ncbi:MAG: hypothetical protein ACPGNT_07395, partial [Rhodospirillales bacterium]